MLANATEEFRAFIERTGIPVAMTLLGIGVSARLASAQPRHDGHARRGLGQYRDPGSGPAHRARHALRRSRHGQPEDLRAQREARFTWTSTRRKSARTCRSTSASSPTCAMCCGRGSRRSPQLDLADWTARIDGLKGDSAVRDIQNMPDDGHLYAAHVIHDIWRATDGKADGRHRRRPASDVGSAVLPSRSAAHAHHVRRSRARWASRCPRRSAPRWRAPTRKSGSIVGDGGFQMTLCELATIVAGKVKINIAIINNGYLGMVRQWQEFFYERRYAATPLLSPDFVETRGGLRHRGMRVQRAPGRRPGGAKRRARITAPCCSTSRWNRRTRCSRWFRPAPTCTR